MQSLAPPRPILHDRSLLGDLARCERSTARDLVRAGRWERASVPGMVVSIQTHGDLVNWQPHLHALVTAGLVDQDGKFTSLDPSPSEVAEEIFRLRFLNVLVRRGKLGEEAASGLLVWKRSGFSPHHRVQVEPWDAAATELPCRYLVHPPIALERLHVLGGLAP